MSNTNIDELLVVIEDSEEDFFAINRAFNEFGKKIPIVHYICGEKALSELDKMEDINSASRIVFLLDVNLPGLSGHKILQKIKSTKIFNICPIIMFTSSASVDDINKAYLNGANSFMKKNVNFSVFSKTIKNMKTYWFETNLLPVKPGSDLNRFKGFE